MIAAGYEDGNDANSLRGDPIFKMALDLTPSDRELCSQSTISRLENLPDARALSRLGRAMVDLYCEVLSPGSQTDRARHRRHLRRRAWRPAIAVVQRALRRVRFSADRRVRRRRPFHHRRSASRQTAGRQGGPAPRAACCAPSAPTGRRREIMLRGDSHYCCPEVLDCCRADGLDYSSASRRPRPCASMSWAWRPTKRFPPGGAEDGKVRRLRVSGRRHELEPC